MAVEIIKPAAYSSASDKDAGIAFGLINSAKFGLLINDALNGRQKSYLWYFLESYVLFSECIWPVLFSKDWRDVTSGEGRTILHLDF